MFANNFSSDISGKLNYTSIPEPLIEETLYDMETIPYKAMLDKSGVREMKNHDYNYINHSLLVDMYDLLMYSGDLKFSSIAAEIIYSTAKLDDLNFVNWCASHYFANRRNQITKFHEGSDFTKVEGKIDIVGKKSK